MTETPKTTEDTSANATPETAAPEAAKGKSKAPPKASPAKGKEISTEVTVLIKDIVLPDDWNREKLGSVSGLVQSIKDVGLINPLTVRLHPDKPGKVILVDGRRRYAALQEIGMARVPIYVKDALVDEMQAYLEALVANLNRESNTDYEVAVAFKRLSDAGKKHKDIARACGKSEGFVSQHLSALKVPEEILGAFQKGKMSFAKVRVFTRLDAERDAEFISKITPAAIDPEVTSEGLGEIVDAHLEKQSKKDGKTRGKAAKTKAEKKRGPAPKMADYASPEIKKMMTPIKDKEKYVEYFTYYRERREKTSSAKRQAYLEGVLEGLELGAGLKVLE